MKNDSPQPRLAATYDLARDRRPRNMTEAERDALLLRMDGMSLRDYFAGQVLAGLSASSERLTALAGIAHNQGDEVTQVFAAVAYQYADAMLAERAKEERNG